MFAACVVRTLDGAEFSAMLNHRRLAAVTAERHAQVTEQEREGEVPRRSDRGSCEGPLPRRGRRKTFPLQVSSERQGSRSRCPQRWSQCWPAASASLEGLLMPSHCENPAPTAPGDGAVAKGGLWVSALGIESSDAGLSWGVVIRWPGTSVRSCLRTQTMDPSPSQQRNLFPPLLGVSCSAPLPVSSLLPFCPAQQETQSNRSPHPSLET